MKNVAKFILMGMAVVVFVCYGSISAYAGGHCGGGYNGCGGRGRNQNYRSTYEETYCETCGQIHSGACSAEYCEVCGRTHYGAYCEVCGRTHCGTCSGVYCDPENCNMGICTNERSCINTNWYTNRAGRASRYYVSRCGRGLCYAWR